MHSTLTIAIVFALFVFIASALTSYHSEVKNNPTSKPQPSWGVAIIFALVAGIAVTLIGIVTA